MATKSFTIDPQNSVVTFQVQKLGVFTIKGNIKGFTGDVSFSKDALVDASFNVCVRPATIDTGNSRRDEHLKSQDFFDVNNQPKICFQSTSIESISGGFMAIGELSMPGVAKETSIPFSFSDGVFAGKFTLNRLDYNLGKKFPAFLVGKTIQIRINCKIKHQ